MKLRILGLLTLASIINSCQKNDEYVVTLKTSGALTVKVTNGSGDGIPDTRVKLYDGNTSGSGYLDAIKTDNGGNVDFGLLNAGSYSLVVDTPKVNGVKYSPYKTIQVVSGSSKKVTINVEDYSGTVSINFSLSSSPVTPFSGLNVILIPSGFFQYDNTLDELIEKAEFSGKTDLDGNVKFKIPSNRDFQLMVYNNSKTNYNTLTYLYVNKDDVRTLGFTLGSEYLN